MLEIIKKSVATVADPKLFEMENNKSYTVQFMYYSTTKKNNWVNILSKSDKHKGSKGWNVHGDGGRIKFRVGNRDVWTSQQSTDPWVSTMVNGILLHLYLIERLFGSGPI